MKKKGIINSEIARVLARLGHTDQIVIADCGLPIPDSVQRIDLAIKLGNPSFITVLDAIMDDMEVEQMTWANEIKDSNSSLYLKMKENYSSIPSEYVSHQKLKELVTNAKVVIRTGECTPYANVILSAGIIF